LGQQVSRGIPYQPCGDAGGNFPQLLESKEIPHLLFPGVEIGTSKNRNSVGGVGRHFSRGFLKEIFISLLSFSMMD
jgi:hypothetical protein